MNPPSSEAIGNNVAVIPIAVRVSSGADIDTDAQAGDTTNIEIAVTNMIPIKNGKYTVEEDGKQEDDVDAQEVHSTCSTCQSASLP